MSRRLTHFALTELNDDEVTLLYHAAEDEKRKDWFGRILRYRTINALSKTLPRSIGTCSMHGQRVMLDDQGAMATGYPYHVRDERGGWASNCVDYHGIVWDPPSPEKLATRALIDTLRASL